MEGCGTHPTGFSSCSSEALVLEAHSHKPYCEALPKDQLNGMASPALFDLFFDSFFGLALLLWNLLSLWVWSIRERDRSHCGLARGIRLMVGRIFVGYIAVGSKVEV